MITRVLHCAGRFINQHTGPNIPHLPASARGPLSLCLSPEPWSEPSVCTLRLVGVCEHVCAHAVTRLCTCCCRAGRWVLFCPRKNHDDATFADAWSGALNMFVVRAAIFDVDLSRPAFIWSRVEQRRLYSCALLWSAPCACLEGRGELRGGPQRSRRLHQSRSSCAKHRQGNASANQTGQMRPFICVDQ